MRRLRPPSKPSWDTFTPIVLIAWVVLSMGGLLAGGAEGQLIIMVAGNLGILYGGLLAHHKRSSDEDDE